MSNQVRFGVSLPKELVDVVDEISSELKVPRSKVIEIALRSFANYITLMKRGASLVMVNIVCSPDAVANVLNKLGKVNACIQCVEDSCVISALTDGEYAKKIMSEISKARGVVAYPFFVKP